MNKTFIGIVVVFATSVSCKKESKPDTTSCFSDLKTERKITDKKAVVKLTATVTEPVYLVEEGSIDTRLIPCDFPLEFYKHNLEVTISGEVKATVSSATTPCCAQNFVITKISK